MSLHPDLRFAEPEVFARRTISAHEEALAGGRPVDLDPRVLHAWRRSGDAGISPEQELPAHFLGAPELERARSCTPLRAVADDVVASLADTSAAGRHLVVLTDAHGSLLWRSGSPEALRRADSIAFAEGADWSEGGIGANGISLALDSGRLSHATAGEHFVRAHHGWTCTAAPIRDRAGSIVGVLDVSLPVRFATTEVVSLVRCGARLAETLLAQHVAISDSTDAEPDANPIRRIRLLGWRPAVVRADGSEVLLSERRAELLALLASREAWTARALAEELYGDASATTTVRGEIKRLRRQTGLSIDSQPYALSRADRACVDFLAADEPDELLPDSEVPAIVDLRYGI